MEQIRESRNELIYKNDQLSFNKSNKVIQWQKDSLFKQMVLEQPDIHMVFTSNHKQMLTHRPECKR